MKKIREAVAVSKAVTLKRFTGGETHSDEVADRSLIKKMVKPEARTGRAGGGKVKAKAKPTVAVNIIAPRGQDRPVPVPVPVKGSATAGPGPVAPSRSPAPSNIQKVIPVPPPQGPLGPLKCGGTAKKRAAGGKITAGAESGLGRLEKVVAQKGKK